MVAPVYLAPVRFHTNQLAMRVLGTLTGLAFLAIGAYAVLGGDASVGEQARERTWWFGVTALVAGAWAIGASWLDSDLSGIWCRPPRRRP
jgi:hypothetical protein